MNDWVYPSRDRRDSISIPTFWVAVGLSLLLHVALMWHWLPRLHIPQDDEPESAPLVVRLSPPVGPAAGNPVPPSRAAPAPPPTVQRSPPPPPRPPATARPAPSPPVIALNQAPANTPSPPAVAPADSAPARPAAPDLASYIEARRLARNESVQEAKPAQEVRSAEDDKARSNSIVSANLAQRPLAFGYDPSKSGGIFDIKRMNYNNAEFMFYGWNKEVRHNTAQLIEVSKGNNSDIRLAVVRKMIAIIREHEQEDFEWTSYRLGRDVTLSARARDTAGLEDFLIQEFFQIPRPSR